MAPISIADTITSAPSKDSVDPTPLEAISHGQRLPGVPSFSDLGEKRQWMYGVLQTPQQRGNTNTEYW